MKNKGIVIIGLLVVVFILAIGVSALCYVSPKMVMVQSEVARSEKEWVALGDKYFEEAENELFVQWGTRKATFAIACYQRAAYMAMPNKQKQKN